MIRWLIVPTMLLVGLPSSCQGTHEVKLPPSKDCPSGIWVVKSEGDMTSAVCKDAPAASPSPSAEPSSSPTPIPSVSPSPSPTAIPSPVPTASPSTTSGPIPVQLHVCPVNYPRKPEHVKVGKNARRAPANPFAWLINLSPLVSEAAGLCQDENGHSRAGADGMCEQWGACATQGLHDDADPQSSWEPGVYAEGPGFTWDRVESRSRPADPAEPRCPIDNHACYINYYLKNLVLGDGGSGPGHYFLCAAVTEAEVKDRHHIAPTAECADFELTLP